MVQERGRKTWLGDKGQDKGRKEEQKQPRVSRNDFNVNYILLILLLVCAQMFMCVLLFAVAHTMLAVEGV